LEPVVPARAVPDIDLTGADRPIAATLSAQGHLLLATRRGVVAWDPSGAQATARHSVAAALFEAGATATEGESPANITVVAAKGGVAENWVLQAVFSDDGALALFSAYSTTFSAAKNYKQAKISVAVLRASTGVVVSTLKAQVDVPSLPEYMFGPAISPGGRFFLESKPYQLEVFDLGTGRKVLSRFDAGFGAPQTFLSDTTLLHAYGVHSLDVIDLPRGQVLHTQRDVQAYALSPDRTRVAILGKGRIRFWSVGTGATTQGCKTKDVCEYCTVEWIDDQHVRLFKASERTQQEECRVDDALSIVAPYAPRSSFRGEGFSVTEFVGPGAAQPARVVATMPNGNEVSLGDRHGEYAAAHGRLLVVGESVRMFDAAGNLILGPR